MGKVRTYPVNTALTTGGVMSNQTLLPPKIDYTPTPSGWVTNTADWWNNRLCDGDALYYQPWEIGDVFRFQLALTDEVNGSVLVAGWRTDTNRQAGNYYVSAQVLDINGNIILNEVNELGDNYWVSHHNKRGAKQSFELDTTKLPTNTDRFYIAVNAYNQDGTILQTFYSEPYGKTQSISVWLEYHWRKLDDVNRYYKSQNATLGEGLISPFVGGFRVPGFVQLQQGSQSPTESDNETVISTEITRTYIYQFYSDVKIGVPDYVANQLITALFADVSVTIDGVAYTDFSEVSKNIESGLAWLPNGTCVITSEVEGFGC